MRKGPPRSIEDIEGPWPDSNRAFETGLVERCWKWWCVPIENVPDDMLATYIRQRIAVRFVAAEATRRIDAGLHDGSEKYDGELSSMLKRLNA